MVLSHSDTIEGILCTEPVEIEVEIEPLEPTNLLQSLKSQCFSASHEPALCMATCNCMQPSRKRFRFRDTNRARGSQAQDNGLEVRD